MFLADWPLQTWSSVIFFGDSICMSVWWFFAESWEMPVAMINQLQMAKESDMDSSHLMGLSVIPAALILFRTPVRWLLCSCFLFHAYTTTLSMWQRTPGMASSILLIIFWKGIEILKGSLLKRYHSEGVIKGVSNLEDFARGTCQNPLLLFSLENSFAPESWHGLEYHSHMWHWMLFTENFLI